MKWRHPVFLAAAIPIVLHALLVLAWYVTVEREAKRGMDFVLLVLMDFLAFVVFPEPQWIYRTNGHTAAWFLVIGSVQWGCLGVGFALLIHAYLNDKPGA